jgi:hypothetical protein
MEMVLNGSSLNSNDWLDLQTRQKADFGPKMLVCFLLSILVELEDP